jgi:hypothetical protein
MVSQAFLKDEWRNQSLQVMFDSKVIPASQVWQGNSFNNGVVTAYSLPITSLMAFKSERSSLVSWDISQIITPAIFCF